MAHILAIHKILRHNNRIFSALLIFNISRIKSNNILEVHDGAWNVQNVIFDIPDTAHLVRSTGIVLVEPLNN